MKRISLALTVVTLGLCFISGTGAFAQKTLKQAIPVTSTIDVSGILQDQTVFNYRIQGDQFGPYHNGVDSVVSELQTGGDWQLNALASPSRSMVVDLRDPVPDSDPTPPFDIAQLPAKIETKSYLLYGNGKVSGMKGLNSTLITPLLVRFDVNGNVYRLRMDSQSYAETDYALVTCTGVVDPNNPGSSQCKQWRVEPAKTQPDGQRKGIARLVRAYTSRGKTIEEPRGDFYLSFSIGVANP
jgi:hypothetical protein